MTEALGREELQGEAVPEERGFEDRLRPGSLAEMIGQDRLRENLAVFIQAAQGREEALDHLLFYGPPGLGKTSLARIVAREMQAQFRATSGPVLERAGDLAAMLSGIGGGSGNPADAAAGASGSSGATASLDAALPDHIRELGYQVIERSPPLPFVRHPRSRGYRLQSGALTCSAL